MWEELTIWTLQDHSKHLCFRPWQGVPDCSPGLLGARPNLSCRDSQEVDGQSFLPHPLSRLRSEDGRKDLWKTKGQTWGWIILELWDLLSPWVPAMKPQSSLPPKLGHVTTCPIFTCGLRKATPFSKGLVEIIADSACF